MLHQIRPNADRKSENIFPQMKTHGLSCLEMCPHLRQNHLYPKLSLTQPELYLSGTINLFTAPGPADSWLLAPETRQSSRRVRGQWIRLITGLLAGLEPRPEGQPLNTKS